MEPKTNLFLEKELIEPNAQISPALYESTALYAALYQAIFGSYVDYGFSDRATLDVFINAKIKTMMTVIDKVFKANPKATYDQIMNWKFGEGGLVKPALSSNSKHYLDEEFAFKHISENAWVKNYLPIIRPKPPLSLLYTMQYFSFSSEFLKKKNS